MPYTSQHCLLLAWKTCTQGEHGASDGRNHITVLILCASRTGTQAKQHTNLAHNEPQVCPGNWSTARLPKEACSNRFFQTWSLQADSTFHLRGPVGPPSIRLVYPPFARLHPGLSSAPSESPASAAVPGALGVKVPQTQLLGAPNNPSVFVGLAPIGVQRFGMQELCATYFPSRKGAHARLNQWTAASESEPPGCMLE